MSLNITTSEPKVGHFLISLTGKLDTETYARLEEVLQQVISTGTRSITFDMEGLTYMSSMGLRVMVKTAKDMKSKKGEMLAINPSHAIAAVLEIAKTLPSFSIFASTEEADAYLANIQKQNS